MKKYVIAIVIAFGALFGLSVEAAPLASDITAVQTGVAKNSAVTNAYYRGYGWHGRGWYGGGYGWRRPYWRGYGWRRPGWGAWGGGWGRPGWGAWGGGWGGCRLRCNPWRCWRVCW